MRHRTARDQHVRRRKTTRRNAGPVPALRAPTAASTSAAAAAAAQGLTLDPVSRWLKHHSAFEV